MLGVETFTAALSPADPYGGKKCFVVEISEESKAPHSNASYLTEPQQRCFSSRVSTLLRNRDADFWSSVWQTFRDTHGKVELGFSKVKQEGSDQPKHQ